ncbi:MAG: flagellar biosynthesis protein [Dehalococcoidia bacterium]|nr:MAG: flagellar biosynthesis protein [Dehalococcoidia bacterium]
MANIDGVGGIANVGGLPSPSVGTPARAAGAGEFGLQFSKHAQKRLEQRGIDLDGARMARLEQAVGQAAAKGSRDSLILLDEMALVVSVQNRTVVTAMDQQSTKEQVFTNIDSVVIAP